MFYDNLPVNARDVVGEVGRGFYHLLDGLNPERILIAAEALGTGRAALRNIVVSSVADAPMSGRTQKKRASRVASRSG